MEANKQLSICIPTYNRADFLDYSLEMHIPMVEKYNIQIFVSDNASTDNTSEVMQKWMAKYEFLHYSRNETNIGFDGNILQVSKQANTEYILFLGDDDIVIEKNLFLLLEDINKNLPDGIFCNYKVELLKANRQYNAYSLSRSRMNLSIYNIFDLLGEKITFMSSLVIKTDLINYNSDNLNMAKGMYFMHLAIMFDALKKSNKIYYFANPIVTANDANPPTYNHYEVFIHGLGNLIKLYFHNDENNSISRLRSEIMLFVLSNHKITKLEIHTMKEYGYKKTANYILSYINNFFGIKSIRIINRIIRLNKRLKERLM